MKITLVTLFPEMFQGFFGSSIIRRAVDSGLVEINCVQIRDFAEGTHRQVDDYPFGGGPGMVMKPEPLFGAVEHSVKEFGPGERILLTPQGKVFSQSEAEKLAKEKHLILICGHYEGVDERVRRRLADNELSIGDFVLTGGEPAAIVIVDAVVRLLPGSLGAEEAHLDESFYSGLLEFPQYTRPREYRAMKVPDILLSGHHAEIKKWRREESLRRTLNRRPELLKKAELAPADRKFLNKIKNHEKSAEKPPAPLCFALIHFPVYDKSGNTVTTSVHGLDLHDIARIAKTYDMASFYIVNPLESQAALAQKIMDHWTEGFGSHYNPHRKNAFELVKTVHDVDEAVTDYEKLTGKKVCRVASGASLKNVDITFESLRNELFRPDDDKAYMLLLGTGWGLSKEVIEQADYRLESICPEKEFNHLSVRSAASIIADRLLGDC